MAAKYHTRFNAELPAPVEAPDLIDATANDVVMMVKQQINNAHADGRIAWLEAGGYIKFSKSAVA